MNDLVKTQKEWNVKKLMVNQGMPKNKPNLSDRAYLEQL